MDARDLGLLRAGLWIGGGIVAAGLGVALSSFATAYFTVHPLRWPRMARMRQHRRRPAAGDGPRGEAVRFPSADGIELAGWHLDRGADATIIVCHGWPGSKDDMRGLAEGLAYAGFNVLAFDFRSWGESGGGPVTLGYREAQDVIGAVRFVTARQAGRAHGIGAFGLSMGAAAAILAAAACPEIEAVVVDGSYTRLDCAVHRVFRLFWGAAAPVFYLPTRWLGERLIGTPMPQVSPLGAIGRISPRPVLIIHGTHDRLVHVDDAHALFRTSGDPKVLWLIEGAGHAETRGAAREAYDGRVAGFFRQHLGGRR